MRNKQHIIVQSRTVFPIVPILGLIFITLKLTGYITWPWVWVLSPFWIPVALFVAIVAFIFIVAVISIGIKKMI